MTIKRIRRVPGPKLRAAQLAVCEAACEFLLPMTGEGNASSREPTKQEAELAAALWRVLGSLVAKECEAVSPLARRLARAGYGLHYFGTQYRPVEATLAKLHPNWREKLGLKPVPEPEQQPGSSATLRETVSVLRELLSLTSAQNPVYAEGMALLHKLKRT